jgi:ureidoglycolate hydrolase
MLYDAEKNACIVQKPVKNSDTALMTKEAFSSWDSTIQLQDNKKVAAYNGQQNNYVKF